MSEANVRLGVNGIEEIKQHPFFNGIDWNNMKNKKAPYIPDLKNDIDTKHFDKFEEIEPWVPSKKEAKRKEPQFIGYTYNAEVEE